MLIDDTLQRAHGLGAWPWREAHTPQRTGQGAGARRAHRQGTPEPRRTFPTAGSRSRVLNGWCDCELSQRRPLSLTWRRECVLASRPASDLSMPLPNTAWKPAERRSHARLLEPCDNEAACGRDSAQRAHRGGANGLGVVNGRNAPTALSLTALDGLLYNVRVQSPGRRRRQIASGVRSSTPRLRLHVGCGAARRDQIAHTKSQDAALINARRGILLVTHWSRTLLNEPLFTLQSPSADACTCSRSYRWRRQGAQRA